MIKSKKKIAIKENIAQLKNEIAGLNSENDLLVKDSIKQAKALHNLRVEYSALEKDFSSLNRTTQNTISSQNSKILIVERQIASLRDINKADESTIESLTNRVKELLSQLSIEKNKKWYHKIFK